MFPREGAARWLVILHLVLLMAIWLVPLAAWQELPDQVPVHFDAKGNPDRHASKSSLSFWLMPIVATVMGILFFVALRFPQVYNHPRKNDVKALPPKMREPVYDILREMMLAIALCIDAIMLYVVWLIVAAARSGGMDLYWPVFAVFMVAPLAVALYYLRRIGRMVDELKARAGATGGG
ncbi:MAG TPA: DUF1648 domain-containing protein [Acidobacteriota bacterium]|nr:DUF1648 domain-containing protein [Acidobacteriota bacterium]